MSDSATQRLDKWLWQARFFKTRSLAAKIVQSGAVRVNSVRSTKPAASVRVGDILTFIQAKDVRVVEIRALGARRGPATEAQTLYEDRSMAAATDGRTEPVIDRAGRPTKKDRRALDGMRRFRS
ncbi:MAG: RNA-binding S4 domain-containing protein [Pseudomonadota bacterium]